MFDLTPQERTALVVISVLLSGGAVARHLNHRWEARDWLQYTSDQADTLSPAGSTNLLDRASAEMEREQVRSTPLQPGEKIDPNTASPEQLDRLPRVGPAVANRIVAHRAEHGRFRTAQDLGEVAGIGPALLEAISPYLTLPRGSELAATGREPAQRVDLNRANVTELQALPGIGPAIAERIVEYRAANGPFRSFEQLEGVPGIGPRLRERIESVARLGG